MKAPRLAADDYRSTDDAQRLLSDQFDRAPSLHRQVKSWENVVAGIEAGFDMSRVWEYTDDLHCRDWLHDAWAILTPGMRARYSR